MTDREVLLDLIEQLWNRHTDARARLDTALSPHSMVYGKTPVSHYPPGALVPYGQLKATRIDLVSVVSHVIGDGQNDAYHRASDVVSRWVSAKVTAGEILEELRAGHHEGHGEGRQPETGTAPVDGARAGAWVGEQEAARLRTALQEWDEASAWDRGDAEYAAAAGMAQQIRMLLGLTGSATP